MTIEEPWSVSVELDHWYAAALYFSLRVLGRSTGKCLVVGSPLVEANMLAKRGWSVTYLDVRRPPDGEYVYVPGDATAMPLEDDSFDAASSTCVLCHAGLGRYGDPVTECGDEKMLAEMYRVMKPGAKGALMLGPFIPNLVHTMTVADIHRVYAVSDAMDMVRGARFEILEVAGWYRGDWLSLENMQIQMDKDLEDGLTNPPYLSMAVEK